MSSEQPSPEPRKSGGKPGGMGPGAPIAFLIIAGVIIGGLLGQPSIGFLVGLGLGVAVALLSLRR